MLKRHLHAQHRQEVTGHPAGSGVETALFPAKLVERMHHRRVAQRLSRAAPGVGLGLLRALAPSPQNRQDKEHGRRQHDETDDHGTRQERAHVNRRCDPADKHDGGHEQARELSAQEVAEGNRVGDDARLQLAARLLVDQLLAMAEHPGEQIPANVADDVRAHPTHRVRVTKARHGLHGDDPDNDQQEAGQRIEALRIGQYVVETGVDDEADGEADARRYHAGDVAEDEQPAIAVDVGPEDFEEGAQGRRSLRGSRGL